MASRPCLTVSRRRKIRDDAPIEFSDLQSIDASEYISRVVAQSSRLPEVLNRKEGSESAITVENKRNKHRDHVAIEGSAASLHYLVSDRMAILPPPSDKHAATSEWVNETLSNFSDLRNYLDGLDKVERKQAVPSMKDRPGWHIFCLGVKEAHGNAGSYFHDDNDNESSDEKGMLGNGEKEDETVLMDRGGKPERDDSVGNQERDAPCGSDVTENAMPSADNNDNDNPPAWRQTLPETGYPPTTSLILQLDQVMIRRVISHLAHYVEEGWHPCSVQRCQWLYALLARLAKPVHRNDAAVLYGLLKALTRARATIPNLVEEDPEGLARLNVLIAIIGVYFEQGGGLAVVMEAPTNQQND